ncbi:hypothetical protein AVEN_261931-1 [Araneus ventricosus]|uniref:Uncharacterized protein n=1 Tax=Araneus ventricosus TaxID=182803 RepID=A0A4Y2L7N9_ARAVE|nr:hypothetical protein AVEN_261931-1 [Araneus ventricosus]
MSTDNPRTDNGEYTVFVSPDTNGEYTVCVSPDTNGEYTVFVSSDTNGEYTAFVSSDTNGEYTVFVSSDTNGEYTVFVSSDTNGDYTVFVMPRIQKETKMRTPLRKYFGYRDIKVMERRYEGSRDTHMVADYCLGLQSKTHTVSKRTSYKSFSMK